MQRRLVLGRCQAGGGAGDSIREAVEVQGAALGGAGAEGARDVREDEGRGMAALATTEEHPS